VRKFSLDKIDVECTAFGKNVGFWQFTGTLPIVVPHKQVLRVPIRVKYRISGFFGLF
jgi:hypothetical protein